jgi:TM2 domain-containing membrane protein YozV
LPIEKKTAADDKKQYAAPKSYVIYTLLAIVLGVFGADKFYLGYTGQGLAKLFSVFNIFLFLFGLLWVLWDAFNAFFRTEALLKEGIVSPLPYSIFFKTPIPAKELFKVQEVKEKNPEEETSQGSGTDWGGLYKQFVVPLLQPSVGKGIQTASQAATVGLKGVAVAKKVGSMDPTSAVGSLSDATGQAAQAQVAQALATPPEQPTVQTIQEIAAAKAAERSGQTGGGGHTVTGGLGPVIAGSLTALVLAGGLKGVYEFLERRHG